MSSIEMQSTPSEIHTEVGMSIEVNELEDFFDFLQQQATVSESIGHHNLSAQNIGSETITLIEQIQTITADTTMAQKLEMTRQYFATISDYVSSGEIACCGGSEGDADGETSESNRKKEQFCTCDGERNLRGDCRKCHKKKKNNEAKLQRYSSDRILLHVV